MNWIRDYNVHFDGKVYERCVECRTHTAMTRDLTEIEVIYINEEGMLDVLTNVASKFKFVRKPQVIVCED